MKIARVAWFQLPDSNFVPTMSMGERNAQFPFRGAAIDDVYFPGKAAVYVCPTCSREFEAVIKKNTETPQTTEKWTTYVSMRGVPKDLKDAFMTQMSDGSGIADAGEPYAFTCMASPGEPRRQFVLAGIQGNIGFIIWHEGGAATQTLAATFVKTKDEWKNNTTSNGRPSATAGKYFDVRIRSTYKSPTPADYIEAIEGQIAGQR